MKRLSRFQRRRVTLTAVMHHQALIQASLRVDQRRLYRVLTLQSTMVNGYKELTPDKAGAIRSGQMDQSTRVGGKMGKQMDVEDLYTPMEIFTRVSGLMIKHTDMALTLILMVLNTSETGKKTSSTVKESRLGLMVQNTTVITSWERNKDMVFSLGLMEAIT